MKDLIRAGVRPSVKGRVAVELFDGRGRRVSRAEQPNMVSQVWLDVMEAFLGFGLFESRNLAEALPVNRLADQFRAIPNYGIMLTDYAAAATQADRAVKGAHLGWASTAYATTASGSRGSYNSGESVSRPFYQKLVFDFATNQANGVFQSVYSGPWKATSDTAAPELLYYTDRSCRTAAAGTLSDYMATVRGDPATGTLVQPGSGPDPTTLRTNTLEGALRGAGWGSVAMGRVVRGVDIRASRLYLLGAISGSSGSYQQSVYSAPLSDLATQTVEKTFDNALLASLGVASAGSSGGFAGLAWSPARGRWLIGAAGSTAAARVWEFDESWNLVGSVLPAGEAVWWLAAFPTDPDAVVAGNWVWDLGSKSRMALSTNSDTVAYRCLSPVGAQLGIGGHRSDTTAFWTPQSMFFSRAVLDNPVTKTSTNTMKISYEFTTQEPSLW
ncbi:MAG: hypothetical protein LBD77_02145 [Bifidobacteriaceae bacterium]|nr:hypothetical protein [Bifidobacteriaceae bacterium]